MGWLHFLHSTLEQWWEDTNNKQFRENGVTDLFVHSLFICLFVFLPYPVPIHSAFLLRVPSGKFFLVFCLFLLHENSF